MQRVDQRRWLDGPLFDEDFADVSRVAFSLLFKHPIDLAFFHQRVPEQDLSNSRG